MNRGRLRTVGPWAVMALCLAVALFVGASHPARVQTPAARAAALETQLRCPSCEDLSVAQSSAPVAVAIRGIVGRRMAEGQSDAAVEAFLVSRYGQSILLRPPVSGGTATVWIVPLVVIGVALAVLAAFFFHRRRAAPLALPDEDRILVERALAESAGS